MKLDEILQGNDALFVFMERYVDETAKTYSPFAGKSEVALEYQSRSDLATFDVFTVHAPANRVAAFEADPTEILRQHYVRPEGVLFAVHPETWSSAGIDHLEELHAFPKRADTGRPYRVNSHGVHGGGRMANFQPTSSNSTIPVESRDSIEGSDD